MATPARAGMPGKALVAALSAVVFVAPMLSAVAYYGMAGRLVTGVVAAVAFWFGVGRLIEWAIATKAKAASDDVADVPLPDPTLAPVLDELERTRVELAAEIDRRMRLRVPLSLGLAVAVWAWGQFSIDPPGVIPLAIYCVVGATLGWLWASHALSERYRKTYKREVLPRLAAGFGTLTYRPAEGVDVQNLSRHRLFGAFDDVTAEDEITGSYHEVPLSIVEVRLTRRSGKQTVVVFDGLLTRVALPRTLRGTTAVIGDAGLFGSWRDAFADRTATRVRLEDPRFEASYEVYGTDQIAARALMTPAFMERFLALGERTGFARPLALAEDNQLTIALPKKGHGDLFEPPDYNHPATSRAAIARLHDELRDVLAVVDTVIDLDQSTRGRAG